ncbi:recQ-mediated genome instability protein 1-like [Paramacrobiotus metropolitanus]|uniref:recQ-mediated genome instability protein 1-like n=1 Tax=Paramacrobiotus metropolitanus TaxID=2943436 RepID=UPI002445E53F|nr:recQ-mediated genome instability protein 1-like [Paramacrobiotus metropolitanus]
MLQVRAYFTKENIILPEPVLSQLCRAAQAQSLNEREIEHLCFDLWRNSDLRAWNLPPQQSPLAKVTKKSTVFEISESIILQIDFLRDISRPAYQQLQKVINRFGENVLVSEEQEAAAHDNTTVTTASVSNKNKTKEESSGKRVLLVEFTDGVTTIRGMEYNPISQLSTYTPPGTKVRLLPPITCRRGMMLLKSANIQLIGGSVPELCAKHAQKYVLASVLKGKEGFLAEMEKAAPPCPPPTATVRQDATIATTISAQQAADGDSAFDPEGDAFMAALPMDEFLPMDSVDTDDFLSKALDAYETQNLTPNTDSADNVIIID